MFRQNINAGSKWEQYTRAYGQVFGEIRPATTRVEVLTLIDPEMLVEIEADAYIGKEW